MTRSQILKLKKSFWEDVAKELKIKFTEETTNELIVLIAKKLGIETKDIFVDDVKLTIHAHFLKIASEEPKEEVKEVKASTKKAAPKTTTKKTTAKPKTESKKEKVKVSDDSEKSKVDNLSKLRKECEELGVAWNEALNETDLANLINMVKGATPPSLPPSIPQESQSQNPIQQNSNDLNANVPQNTKPDPSEVNLGNLRAYAETFSHLIKNHWRPLTEGEVRELFNRDKYPFNYTLAKKGSTQLEITLKSGKNSVRIPFEKNEFFKIQ